MGKYGIILKWILNRVLGCGLHSSGSGKRSVAQFCKHGNELSSFIKDGKFIDYISDYSFSK
jgi:hypothetical protein